ncbi:MAG: patatin-like phospholipase family protein [Alphaproteobacteria bacterium]
MPLVAGCSSLTRLPPAPAGVADQVTVLGIPNGRFWPDTQARAMAAEAIAARERERATLAATGRFPPANFLAVSGGGDNGAFGAGLLCGWYDSGTIPTFNLVTGVSTGAMIAPFAFLGGPYYNRLRTLYTTITPSDVMETLGLYGAVFGTALADTTPLFHLIARYLDERMFADIADAYRKGRLLLIGTTNLDQQRPVIWNIGAIAATGRPEALTLVHKILLASAAIPGAFPPVLIDVEAGGRSYQEMHVDGGAVVQTFLYPANISLVMNMRSPEFNRERHAYIIRNGRLDPNWTEVEPQFISIAGRAIATMIHYSGVNDILRIYATTKRDGVDYNLAYIGPDFADVDREQFDPVYMRNLFDYGYAKGRAGYPWSKVPPYLDLRLQS